MIQGVQKRGDLIVEDWRKAMPAVGGEKLEWRKGLMGLVGKNSAVAGLRGSMIVTLGTSS